MGPIIIQDLDQEDPAITVVAPAGSVGDVIRVTDPSGNVLQRVAAGGAIQKATAEYSFARSGGAVSTITLTDVNGNPITLPDNAVILRANIEAVSSLTSGGSPTVALGITGSTACFLAATAFNNAAFVTDGVTAANAALPRKTTGVVSLLATIATATITGGIFRIHVEWVLGA